MFINVGLETESFQGQTNDSSNKVIVVIPHQLKINLFLYSNIIGLQSRNGFLGRLSSRVTSKYDKLKLQHDIMRGGECFYHYTCKTYPPHLSHNLFIKT